MARPPRRKRIETLLRCNACQGQFEGPAWHVSIESADRGTVGWVPDTAGYEGNTCPHCGSNLIGYAH